MADVCKKCGNNLYGNKVSCPFCNEPIKKTGYSNSGRTTMNSNNVYRSGNTSNSGTSRPRPVNNRALDSGGGGWGLLGFCVPIAGIVLYFVWKNEKPNTASACLTGALISIGLSIFLNVVTACMASV